MARPIACDLEDGIAVLTLDAPPQNGLSPAMRAALSEELTRLAADDAVQGVVLIGAGGHFSDGLSLLETDRAAAAEGMRALCRQLEEMPRPVVAALEGDTLSAGFELALAAHARVARAEARIGLPEVAVGLLPVAGATQRLPRLGGAGAALDLLLSPRPVTAGDPQAAPFIDSLADDNLRATAVAVARAMAAGGTLRRASETAAGLSDPQAFQAELSERRARLQSRPDEAPKAILRCVEAAQLLPFEAGLAFEAEAAEEALAGEQSAALRHLHAAEQRAWVHPDFPPDHLSGPVDEIATVGIVGGGALAIELAVLCLDAGMTLTLHGRDQDSAEALAGRVAAIYDRALARGRMTSRAREDRIARLMVTDRLDEAADADLVVETTGADPDSRAVLLERLARNAPEGAVLVTTGETGALADMAEETGRPARLLGLRPVRPAHVMRLVELVSTPARDMGALQALTQALRGMGRMVVHSPPRDLPLGEEMQLAQWHALLTLAGRGLSPYRIDAALRRWGMAGSLLQAMDTMGLPALSERLETAGFGRPLVLEALVAAGHEGRSAGRGFLRWPEAGAPEADPDLAALLAELHPEEPEGGRMPEAEVLALVLSATANRGAALLRTGQARRPGDLDVAMVYGHGFSRLRGGPMQAADWLGPFEVQRRLDRFAAELETDPSTAGEAGLWRPDPLLRELVKTGQGFASLD